jgi:hypothetical protein
MVSSPIVAVLKNMEKGEEGRGKGNRTVLHHAKLDGFSLSPSPLSLLK